MCRVFLIAGTSRPLTGIEYLRQATGKQKAPRGSAAGGVI